MSTESLTTPVALFAFNRPDTTERVLERIVEADPPEVYVIADGPRSGHHDDPGRCMAVRLLIERTDWNCPVHRCYRDHNRGLPAAVHEGLDWVFDSAPEAIVLEDDTVPSPDFFRFCELLLDRYRDEDRVMAINGTNRMGSWKADSRSYHFVTFQGVWGWATWRDAWERYDPGMEDWTDPDVRKRVREHLDDPERYRYYRRRFDRSYEGISPSWSRRWRFAVLANEGYCAVPSRNLVSNVGFDDRAVHTTDPESPLAEIPCDGLQFPLDHPSRIEADRTYERRCHDRFRRPSYPVRLTRRITPRVIRSAVPTSVARRMRSYFQ